MQSDMYPLCPYHDAWKPGTPLGTRAGGAVPGPTLPANVAAREIHRPRERPQRSLTPEVEVRVEVAHDQLAQRAMDGLAVREAVVVRLSDRAPQAAVLEHSNNVIGVMFGLEVEEERGEPEHAEPCCGEDRRLETVRRPLVQDASR